MKPVWSTDAQRGKIGYPPLCPLMTLPIIRLRVRLQLVKIRAIRTIRQYLVFSASLFIQQAHNNNSHH